MHQFRFDLNQSVSISCSGEIGTVVARAEYSNGEDQYLVRYRAADGRACEAWWGDSALTS